MFSLAAAIVAMSSAITLTSCDKLFGGHVCDGGAIGEDTLTEQNSTDSTDVMDSTDAATIEAEATDADAAPATEAPADKDK